MMPFYTKTLMFMRLAGGHSRVDDILHGDAPETARPTGIQRAWVKNKSTPPSGTATVVFDGKTYPTVKAAIAEWESRQAKGPEHGGV